MTIYYPPGTGAPEAATGQYVLTSSPQASSTLATHGTGTLRLFPWILPRAVAIDRLGAEVTTIGDAGSKVRLGIYGDTGACYPGALLLDAGQIAGDSATVQELAVSLMLPAGLYWLGGVVQSVSVTQPILRINSNWTPPVLPGGGTSLLPSNAQAGGFTQGSVTAALPANFSSTVAATGSCVRIFVRFA